MSVWYAFTPADTLFFRGAEPLDPGISYQVELVFPPPPSVISGAMRTAVLSQKDIPITEYAKGHEIDKVIGGYGTDAPFSIIGPFLKNHESCIYYVPAPYTWFTEEDDSKKKINILFSVKADKNILETVCLKSSSQITHWVRHKNEIKSIGGSWISLDAIKNQKTRLDTNTELLMGTKKDMHLFSVETRTGIEIDSFRNVKESQIYNAKHIRLRKNISLVWGIDKACGLEAEGVLSLGGEQRFGMYEMMQSAPEFPAQGDQYLALGPVPVNEATRNSLIATGKIIYRGGWNLKKQFHKSMKPYYPPGSVFSDKINYNCIVF